MCICTLGSIPVRVDVPANASLDVVLDGVICRGGETSLLDCTHPGIGMRPCERSEVAAVKCEGKDKTCLVSRNHVV